MVCCAEADVVDHILCYFSAAPNMEELDNILESQVRGLEPNIFSYFQKLVLFQ